MNDEIKGGDEKRETLKFICNNLYELDMFLNLCIIAFMLFTHDGDWICYE